MELGQFIIAGRETAENSKLYEQNEKNTSKCSLQCLLFASTYHSNSATLAFMQAKGHLRYNVSHILYCDFTKLHRTRAHSRSEISSGHLANSSKVSINLKSAYHITLLLNSCTSTLPLQPSNASSHHGPSYSTQLCCVHQIQMFRLGAMEVAKNRLLNL